MSIQEKTPDNAAQTKAPADIPAGTVSNVESAKKSGKVKRIGLMILVPALLIGGGGYMYLTGGRYEKTENANLLLSKVAISSEVSGRVIATSVVNDMAVKKGDVLFEVDPEPLKIALAQAEAAIATARLNVSQLKAAYQQSLISEKAAESDLAYAQDIFDRYQTLANKGVAATSSFDDARHARQQADEKLSTAKQTVVNTQVALGPALNGAIDDHPSVVSAMAARDKAAYNLKAATVRAPSDGILYEASDFRPGKYVTPGTSLFALVETKDPWVEANFKETQLTHMAANQKAQVTFDALPDRHFNATVKSIGAGTGAEFSLLPAQNATGNWVKVTQRIPVRLTLDNAEAKILMRSGLSATVTVDTGFQRHLSDLIAPAHAAE